MSEMQRRRICPPRQRRQRRSWPSKSFLRLLSLPGLRFHHAPHAHTRPVPEVGCAVHRREAQQDRPRTRLHQRGLRLGDACPRSPAAGTAGGSSCARGSQVLTYLHLTKQGRNSAFRGFACAYTVFGRVFPPGVVTANESSDCEVSPIPSVGEKFLAAYDSELSQGSRTISRLSIAARGPASCTHRRHPPHDS